MANFIRSLVRLSFDSGTEGPMSADNGNAVSMITWNNGGSEQKFCYVNDRYARMHGYSVKDLVGAPLSKVFSKSAQKTLSSHLQSIAKNGHYTFASEHVKTNGAPFKVIVDVRSVMDDQGERKYCIATVSPICFECADKN